MGNSIGNTVGEKAEREHESYHKEYEMEAATTFRGWKQKEKVRIIAASNVEEELSVDGVQTSMVWHSPLFAGSIVSEGTK